MASKRSLEVQKIKARYPVATYVGVADGAADNWVFLKPLKSVQILEFYHVSEYVADAAEALYPGKQATGDRQAWLKQKLHDLKHEEGLALSTPGRHQNLR